MHAPDGFIDGPTSAVLGLVAAGGAVGTGVRYLISAAFPQVHGIPVATLGINVVGAFLLGALLEGRWAATRDVAPRAAREASGLTSAFATWHLDRSLRSMAHVER